MVLSQITLMTTTIIWWNLIKV